MIHFETISSFIKCKLFNQFCCSFYGSPLWYLGGAAVQQLCTDWRKALRSMWNLSPKTHCTLVTALSDQTPLSIILKKRYIKFLTRNMGSGNNMVRLITCLSICNPMSVSGRNYRSVLNHHGVTNMDRSMLEWNDRCIQLSSTIAMLKELIGVRDGHGECVGFTFDEIGSFILDICIN